MVFSEALHKKILQAIFNINVKTSSLDAEIITELILSGKASEVVSRKKQLAQSANAVYEEHFEQNSPAGHPLSFYRWLPIKGHFNAEEIVADLEQAGIRVFHSNRFLCGHVASGQFLRIALSSTNSLSELRSGLEILRQYLS